MTLAHLTVKAAALEAKIVKLGVIMMGGATGILTIAAEKASKISNLVKMIELAQKPKSGTASMNSCI